MKIMSINNSYQQIKQQTQFKGNLAHKAKIGLMPLVLTGGLLMAQPVNAGDTSNFYPENEYSVPSGETPMKFLKCMIIGAAGLYVLFGISDKINDNKEKNIDA